MLQCFVLYDEEPLVMVCKRFLFEKKVLHGTKTGPTTESNIQFLVLYRNFKIYFNYRRSHIHMCAPTDPKTEIPRGVFDLMQCISGHSPVLCPAQCFTLQRHTNGRCCND